MRKDSLHHPQIEPSERNNGDQEGGETGTNDN